MNAHRALIETDDEGRPVNLPALPPRSRFEAIFLTVEADVPAAPGRTPPASLSGIQIVGDILAPAIDESDWPVGS